MKDMSEYFKYVENKDQKWTGIGLTSKAGKYEGVVYRYGKVSISEDKENDKATLHFEWDMLDSNDLPKEFFGDDFFALGLAATFFAGFFLDLVTFFTGIDL